MLCASDRLRWGCTTLRCNCAGHRMEQGPTEPHAGRSTFLLSSGGAGGRVLLSGLWYGAHSYSEPVSLPDASGMSGPDAPRETAPPPPLEPEGLCSRSGPKPMPPKWGSLEVEGRTGERRFPPPTPSYAVAIRDLGGGGGRFRKMFGVCDCHF